MFKYLFYLIVILCFRLLPHPANVTPIISIGLFLSVIFEKQVAGICVFMGAMLISDLSLGLHTTMIFTYSALLLIALLGQWIKGVVSACLWSFVAATLFFVLSNFGVWLTSGMYPLSWDGMVSCYIYAIPFFINSLLATTGFSVMLSLVYALPNREPSGELTGFLDKKPF